MRIEQAGMGNHVNNQAETAAPGMPVQAQLLQGAGARTDGNSAPVPGPEAAPRPRAIHYATRLDNRVMEFTIDPSSRKQVVKIMDGASHELVRQIPMEEVLALAKSLDQLKGLLLQAKA